MTALVASDRTWFERDTTPAAIEAALRRLLVESRHGEHSGAIPARVLNLVTVVDRQWRGEIENRLERVGRYHASRTVLLAVEPRRTTIDARATVHVDAEPHPSGMTTAREHLVLDVGAEHVEHLATIVDPLVVTDLPTMLWAPHGHAEAIDELLPLAQVVLLDSVDEPDLEDALARARALARRAYVVDLAWLRSTPWRERIAGAFDPPAERARLATIAAVEVRHHPDSAVAGVLLLGWLCARLGWRPGALAARRDRALEGRARARRGEVRLVLRPAPEQPVRGLAGLTIETGDGTVLRLDRGEGGLRAERVTRRGGRRTWTVLGASRGEPGILGEGIRQALLRDPTYRPALDAAAEMVA
ncbi:MAG: glucose-6-phosphate dehydrogenase assembly protein OpcA [Solirubrobacteraceae bacterium]|nr:glucose-6-phosphate dehydrogenase assembly protein OpcA [Solirubrobacteraceae bacterium]